MTTPALEVNGMTVRYGRRSAVDDVSLSVRQGSVYALLGRNGAGKSSLVRGLLGFQRLDAGGAKVFGRDVWRHRREVMDRIGVVAEDPDAPPAMRVRELAAFSARLYSRWNQPAFDGRLERFAIDRAARFGDLSKGQKKQVSLALALASEPELLVLDDPSLGLDVVARKSLFEEVIADIADRGLTVFVTTHDLAPVETIADRVGILSAGRLVLDEELEALKARFRRIRTTAQPPALASAELVTASVRQWGSGTEAVVSNFDDLALERFREAGEPVSEATPMTLEEIFIAVAGEVRA